MSENDISLERGERFIIQQRGIESIFLEEAKRRLQERMWVELLRTILKNNPDCFNNNRINFVINFFDNTQEERYEYIYLKDRYSYTVGVNVKIAEMYEIRIPTVEDIPTAHLWNEAILELKRRIRSKVKGFFAKVRNGR